jgi:hypothetical protein
MCADVADCIGLILGGIMCREQIRAYLEAAKNELESHKNLINYELRVVRDLVEFGLKGSIHDLHKIGNSANRIIEMQGRIWELNHKVKQFEVMLEEVEK